MTMKGKTILLATLLAILPSSIDAQKKKSAPKAKAKQKATVVDKEFELRLESMRGATQKVMFIDSIVVNKSRLLSSLNIPDEAGGIHPYNNFFNTFTYLYCYCFSCIYFFFFFYILFYYITCFYLFAILFCYIH